MIAGGKLIGYGTHGKIYEIDNDSSMVKKEFDNRPNSNMCLCHKIKIILTPRCFRKDNLN